MEFRMIKSINEFYQEFQITVTKFKNQEKICENKRMLRNFINQHHVHEIFWRNLQDRSEIDLKKTVVKFSPLYSQINAKDISFPVYDKETNDSLRDRLVGVSIYESQQNQDQIHYPETNVPNEANENEIKSTYNYINNLLGYLKKKWGVQDKYYEIAFTDCKWNGESCGLAIALAMYSLLNPKQELPSKYATGKVMSDFGRIQSVGGYERKIAAICKYTENERLLIPFCDAVEIDSNSKGKIIAINSLNELEDFFAIEEGNSKENVNSNAESMIMEALRDKTVLWIALKTSHLIDSDKAELCIECAKIVSMHGLKPFILKKNFLDLEKALTLVKEHEYQHFALLTSDLEFSKSIEGNEFLKNTKFSYKVIYLVEESKGHLARLSDSLIRFPSLKDYEKQEYLTTTQQKRVEAEPSFKPLFDYFLKRYGPVSLDFAELFIQITENKLTQNIVFQQTNGLPIQSRFAIENGQISLVEDSTYDEFFAHGLNKSIAQFIKDLMILSVKLPQPIKTKPKIAKMIEDSFKCYEMQHILKLYFNLEDKKSKISSILNEAYAKTEAYFWAKLQESHHIANDSDLNLDQQYEKLEALLKPENSFLDSLTLEQLKIYVLKIYKEQAGIILNTAHAIQGKEEEESEEFGNKLQWWLQKLNKLNAMQEEWLKMFQNSEKDEFLKAKGHYFLSQAYTQYFTKYAYLVYINKGKGLQEILRRELKNMDDYIGVVDPFTISATPQKQTRKYVKHSLFNQYLNEINRFKLKDYQQRLQETVAQMFFTAQKFSEAMEYHSEVLAMRDKYFGKLNALSIRSKYNILLVTILIKNFFEKDFDENIQQKTKDIIDDLITSLKEIQKNIYDDEKLNHLICELEGVVKDNAFYFQKIKTSSKEIQHLINDIEKKIGVEL